jgi:integrase
VKTAWRNALQKSGVDHLPIYNCRHTFGTRLAGSGVSDTVIDQLMGHARRDVLRFYTARNLDHHRDAIARLDELRRVKTEGSLKTVEPVPQFPIAKGSLMIQ